MLMSLMVLYCHLNDKAFIKFGSTKMLSIFHLIYLECLKCIVGLSFLSNMINKITRLNDYKENKDDIKFICNHKLVNDESMIRLLNPTTKESNHKTCYWIVTYTCIVKLIDTLWKF